MLDLVADFDDEPNSAAVSAHRQLVEELYRRHFAALVGLAASVLGSRAVAEDVAQEAFASLYHRRKPLTDPAGAVGYLRRSVVNGARNHLRHAKVVEKHATADRLGPGHPDQQPGRSEDAEAITAALASLPLRQRECVTLRYQLDLSNAEIAATLDISIGAAKVHLHRANRKLRTLLEQHR